MVIPADGIIFFESSQMHALHQRSQKHERILSLFQAVEIAFFLALSWWDVWQVSTWGDTPTPATEDSGIHWHSKNLLRMNDMILETAIRIPTIRLYIVGESG